MAAETSMTVCLAAFFWISFIVLLLKLFTGVRSLALDGLFVAIVLGVMLLMFASIMKERCGTAPLGAVLKAVLPPWLFMLGGIVVLVHMLPGWIQPFSNTFGYLLCLMPALNSQEKLTAILAPETNTLSKLIVEDPNLMLNQFASATFDKTVLRMQEGGVVSRTNLPAIAEFRKLIHMKDSVAEFLWYLLVGCVAITTSYNLMMNTVCQKSTIVDLPIPKEEDVLEMATQSNLI